LSSFGSLKFWREELAILTIPRTYESYVSISSEPRDELFSFMTSHAMSLVASVAASTVLKDLEPYKTENNDFVC
jgi:hypothetical protein